MKKSITIGGITIAAILGAGVYIFYPRLNLITGFAAKNVCSCVFEANRNPETVASQDNNFNPINLSEYEISSEEKWATATVFGLKKRKAVYTPGLGCTLLPENAKLEQYSRESPRRHKTEVALPYPYGVLPPVDSVFSNVDNAQLEKALENAFFESHQTRAVVVLYQGHLLAEKYAPGFSKESEFLAWSMTKSLTSAVLGVLEKQGKINLEQDHLFDEWEHDARANISLDNLIQMNSGLEWEEDYTKISDVTKMLFLAENMGKVQLEKPLTGRPGKTWNYSSGTTNLLSNFIRTKFTSHQEYLNFWYSEFIDKIGMHSLTLETDFAGNYVGSSYSWATARDWAKFGLLYLNQGNWQGEQIFSENWAKYTLKVAEGSDGRYGAHFWLNSGGFYPDLPRDLYSANGFQGQHVFIIPSKNMVVVRFGLIEHPDFDINLFLKEMLAVVE